MFNVVFFPMITLEKSAAQIKSHILDNFFSFQSHSWLCSDWVCIELCSRYLHFLVAIFARGKFQLSYSVKEHCCLFPKGIAAIWLQTFLEYWGFYLINFLLKIEYETSLVDATGIYKILKHYQVSNTHSLTDRGRCFCKIRTGFVSLMFSVEVHF